MTSIIKLQALTGGGPEAPHCYMLQVDDCSVLLDCGWDEHCSVDLLKEVIANIGRLDAVLLSYADPLHLGALPYLVGKCGLACPIYATVPTLKMGQLFMYDLFQSRLSKEEFDLFSLDDVDNAFDRVTQLKYNQTVTMKGRGLGLTITPLNAGHMVGGTIWKILKDGEEDILYAVDFNHKRERHLNGCVLESLQRPSMLITDAFNAKHVQDRRRTRDEQLMTKVLQTLRGGGDVLIATDTGGRVLELAHMVDHFWRQETSGLAAYSVAILNNVCFNVIEFSKSLLEWMSERLMRAFEGVRMNPFTLKHVAVCHTLEELEAVPSPKVVLASGPDVEYGFSRELFQRWCGNEKDTIILTQRTSKGTLARSLIDGTEGPPNLRLMIRDRIRLEGGELEQYLEEKERKRRSSEGAGGMMNHSRHLSGADEIDEVDDDSDDEDLLPSRSYGADERKKGMGHGGPMFYYSEEKPKTDDYGEPLKPDEFKYLETQGGGGGQREEAVEAMEVEVEGGERGGLVGLRRSSRKSDGVNGVSEEVPTKCVASIKNYPLRAKVAFIDFEGRSDGDSNKKLLAHIKPRRVVLVRGTAEGLAELRDTCRRSEGIERVFVQNGSEVIDATTESHIYQVLLKESLLSTVSFIPCAGKSEVAWINARVHFDDQSKFEAGEEEPKKTLPRSMSGSSEGGQAKPAIPPLEPILPPTKGESEGIPTPISSSLEHPVQFINDLKLSDFKQILANCGIESEFTQGTLWCENGTVALKRLATGQVVIEGTLTPQFYQIRSLLYGQYAVI
ncbi:unnamed protein product [Cyprideis torosa]|uniref:Cleavage and polyadenylation specificity factor subunit 2 n=1 Tax=Cyprideis torosa TaxID=163714 RepID=A0A7R8ZQJ7_9CRUS|nr:unnamed protein product [Cyprideis torosa]CAG0890838.1 unnamed protein product [Cyprideis torosa]